MSKIYFQGTFGAYSHLAALSIYPEAKIVGHNEFSKKDCPSFDVQQWLSEITL